MCSNEMATISCQQDLSPNGLTIIAAVPDLLTGPLAAHCADKDSGALSEPDDLRRSSKRTRTRRSLFFKEKADLVGADVDHGPAEQSSNGKELATSTVTSEERKKQRSLWTIPETQAFFEALAEHGKDFHAIQTFIQNKLSPDSKKNKSSSSNNKSAPIPLSVSSSSASSAALPPISHAPAAAAAVVHEVKSREQVRHFYYRTWHKISSSCHFDDVLKLHTTSVPETGCEDSPDRGQEMLKEVDKAILELYGLINFGEIWKKFPSKWDSRIKSHLKELVLEGSTVIKSGAKVKAIKIKTPICKALKKINGLILDSETTPGANSLLAHSLPDDIVIQLLPKDNASFLKVQSMAQNPRLQCRVCLQKKISSLALFLEQYKWATERQRRMISDEFPGVIVDESALKSNGSVKLTLHPSQLRSLDPFSAGLAISHTINHAAEASSLSSGQMTHPCSSMSLSFKSFLKNVRGRKGVSKAGSKNARKEKVAITSAPVATATTALDAATPVSQPIPAAENVVVEIEDSCSSTSSITPFRDAVKKLAQLNQALGTGDTVYEENAMSAHETTERPQDASDSRKDLLTPQDSEVAASLSVALVDDNEVSLPPPTATLAQWLSSREDRHSDVVDMVDLVQDDSIQDDEKVQQSSTSPSVTVEEKIVLDIETIKTGWTSEETSIAFSELYLLLKSPAKIVLNYEFVDPDACLSEDRQFLDSEQRYFRNITSQEEDSPHESISLLDKLLTAASISLSLHRKLHVSSNTSACFPAGIAPAANSTTSASNQQSAVTISKTNTISVRSPVTNKKHQLPSLQPHMIQSLALVADPAPTLSSHNFLMPTGPAPKAVAHISSNNVSSGADSHTPVAVDVEGKASSSSNNRNNKRQRIICEDPQLLEDAIKQLNQSRFMPKKRQRVIRPITVGPVSSKLLLPRQTLQMIPGPAAAPPSQIQILSAPAAVTVPVTDSGNATTTASGLSLPICFTPSAVSVPTILIPTMIATSLNAVPAAGSVESDSNVTGTLTPAPAADPATLSQSETSSTHAGRRDGLDHHKASESLCETAAADLNLSQNSNSSLPCLSSLLELSLPDPTTPVTSSSISHSFFSDNSNSSISEFISFGNPNMGQSALTGGQAAAAGLSGAGKEGSKNGQTPNWLLNEGSNSSSLGLSSLMFSTNELI